MAAERTWPAGFLWGTGASSTQCEGASPASDWWDWGARGQCPGVR
jgi:beta-glucosidase